MRSLWIVGLIAWTSAAVASAEQINYNYGGVITASFGDFLPGDIFGGSLAFDSASPNTGTESDGVFSLERFYLFVSLERQIEDEVLYLELAQDAEAPLGGSIGSVEVGVASGEIGSFDRFAFSTAGPYDGGETNADFFDTGMVRLIRADGGAFTFPATLPLDLTLADFDYGELILDGLVVGTLFGFGRGVPIIPEPATWALMIAGFGLVGAALRRRRVVVPA